MNLTTTLTVIGAFAVAQPTSGNAYVDGAAELPSLMTPALVATPPVYAAFAAAPPRLDASDYDAPTFLFDAAAGALATDTAPHGAADAEEESALEAVPLPASLVTFTSAGVVLYRTRRRRAPH